MSIWIRGGAGDGRRDHHSLEGCVLPIALALCPHGTRLGLPALAMLVAVEMLTSVSALGLAGSSSASASS